MVVTFFRFIGLGVILADVEVQVQAFLVKVALYRDEVVFLCGLVGLEVHQFGLALAVPANVLVPSPQATDLIVIIFNANSHLVVEVEDARPCQRVDDGGAERE